MKFVLWKCGCIALESGADAIVLRSHESPNEVMFSYQKGGASTENPIELGEIDQVMLIATIENMLKDGAKFRQIKSMLNTL